MLGEASPLNISTCVSLLCLQNIPIKRTTDMKFFLLSFYIYQGGPRGVIACRSNFVQHAKKFVQHAKILWNILENAQQSD